MKVFVDHMKIEKRYTMEVRSFDTVLAIKEAIERSLRIPVNQQTIFFNGRCLLDDNLDVTQCKIVDNSRLLLYTSSKSYNISQVLRQTEQSPAPSNSTRQIIHGQDLPAMVRSNYSQVLRQTEKIPVPSNSTQQIIHGQDLPAMVRSNYSQVLRQTEQSPVPSNSTQQIIHGQDLPAMGRSNYSQVLRQTEQSPVPSNLTQQIIHGQDLPAMVRSNYSQVLRQTEQSPVPSNLTQQIIHGQDFPAMVRSNNSQVLRQTEQSPSAPSNRVEELISNQGWPVMVGRNNDQVLQTEQSLESLDSVQKFLDIQTEQSPVPSDSIGETIYGEDRALTTDMFSNIQSYWPVTTQEINYCQDSSVMERSNINESLPSTSSEELLGIQDLPSATVRSSSNNTKQVIQTEKYPQSSDSVKELIIIPDSRVKKRIKMSRMKLTVMVMPFKETRKIPVEVNAGDNVEKLRNELVKIQERGELNLPQEGYIFIHKQDVLDEDKSFWWNDVAHGDTIEIFRGTIVHGRSTAK